MVTLPNVNSTARLFDFKIQVKASTSSQHLLTIEGIPAKGAFIAFLMIAFFLFFFRSILLILYIRTSVLTCSFLRFRKKNGAKISIRRQKEKKTRKKSQNDSFHVKTSPYVKN